MANTIEPKKQFLSNLSPNKKGDTVNWNNVDFPTSKTEKWKYTRVGKLTKNAFDNTLSENITKEFVTEHTKGYSQYITFDNGKFQSALSSFKRDAIQVVSTTANLELTPAMTSEEKDIFSTVNEAFSTDGLQVNIAKNKEIKSPVLILNIISANNAAAILQNNINVGQGSSVNFAFKTLNTNNSDNGHFNVVNLFNVGENAQLNSFNLQTPNTSSSIIETTQVNLERSSTYSSYYYSTDGSLIRNNITAKINGEGAEANLYGLTLAKDKAHIDHSTLIDHRVPNCESNEMYKTVVDDKSVGVFNGKVFVRPDAQKTNAFQSSQAIVLNDDANVYAKPELEIYADDVKCSHGSTTGQLDEEAKFYLKSRGIGEDAANKMLIKAFAAEIMENIKPQVIVDQFEAQIEKYFQ